MESLQTALENNLKSAVNPAALAEMTVVAELYHTRMTQIITSGTVNGKPVSDGGLVTVMAPLYATNALLLSGDSSFQHCMFGIATAAAIIENTALGIMQSSGSPTEAGKAVLALDSTVLTTLILTTWAAHQKIKLESLTGVMFAVPFAAGWVEYLKELYNIDG